MCKYCNDNHAFSQDDQQITETDDRIPCTHCGELHEPDELTEVNGAYVCDDCLSDHYYQCEECREYVPNDEIVWVRDGWREGDYVPYCPDCTEGLLNYGDISVCDECGEYVLTNVAERDENRAICAQCWDRYDYCYCAECGEILRTDDAYYAESRGEYLCSDCYEKEEEDNGYIHGYHDGAMSELRFHSTDNEPLYHGNVRYFGLELEVDDARDGSAIENTFRALNDSWYVDDDTHAHFEHDGSLNCGFEIITQPMTRAYLESYKPRIAEACEILTRAGYKSHDARMCGLHIHVSRNSLSEETINKMIVAMSLYWYMCVVISRRTMHQLSCYAKSYAYAGECENDTAATVCERAKHIKDTQRSRYFALNTTNSDTIELRICRGTLKVDTIYASIDFFNALIEFAETFTEDEMLRISPDEFVAFLKSRSTILKEYMETRGL